MGTRKITIEDQLQGLKMLDRAYECYKKTGDFAMLPDPYEFGFAFLKEFVGMKKLTEIYYNTNGTQLNVRKAQIKYLFDEIFDKNEKKQ